MNRLVFIFLYCFLSLVSFSQNNSLAPDKIYGQLFIDVQMQKIFPDSKTFVDCNPVRDPKNIVYDYGLIKKHSSGKFSLEQFVRNNFKLPEAPSINFQPDKPDSIATHIKNLWSVLRRNPDKPIEGGSLLGLPFPYIVPGGRFREVYYWDSYFTMLGLRESNEWEMIENMIKNFSWLIQTYGHIPNGNRTYYLSRSQAPFFSLMIDLLAEKKGVSVYADYLSSLQKEYDYWMDKTAATKHVVIMPDGSLLNRYYDQESIPRQESYREDDELANKESQKSKDLAGQKQLYSRYCRDLRSGAESGWDFSSRWFSDGVNISTIQTTNIVPVDLNALLYHLELTLANGYKQVGDLKASNGFIQKAEKRKRTIFKYCWNETVQWYVDYVISLKKQSKELTLAGMAPLFFQIATLKQASEAGKTLKQKFLKSGGLTTTLKNTGQQWDAPNGWAPLEWMAIKGLANYRLDVLASDIAHRWINLNSDVYKRTGKMMEKYNVENTELDAGGGEYPGQDGFGWTNGVFLKLIALYGK